MPETQAVLFAEGKMKRPDVETLIAYAKGAVTPEKARQIERYLDGNSDARRVIEDFRRMQAALTSAAFEAPTKQAAPRRSNNAPMPRPRRSPGAHGMAPPARVAGPRKRATVLAASLAVIAALGLGGFLLREGEESPIALGRLATIDTLSAALTRLASGTPDMAGDRAVTVLMTFRDAARRACRKFEISDTSPTAPRIIAIACQDSGAWRIEGAAWLKSEFAPASSESADPLAALVNKLGGGEPLAPAEEAALIGRDWQDETGQ
jgi:hypothetical protein